MWITDLEKPSCAALHPAYKVQPPSPAPRMRGHAVTCLAAGEQGGEGAHELRPEPSLKVPLCCAATRASATTALDQPRADAAHDCEARAGAQAAM